MASNQFGDFQTPLELAQACLSRLDKEILQLDHGSHGPLRLLEPTCGYGSFLHAAAQVFPDSERIGIEVQEKYVGPASAHGTILAKNIFETDLAKGLAWESQGYLAVVGNPPWVTSAELSRLDSKNLPHKSNFKGAKGLEALLGSSNFDVCEYIITKAILELARTKFTLGMLCKTHVARNVLEYAWRSKAPVASASIYEIDAKRWFGAAVDACWFVVHVDPAFDEPSYVAKVYGSLEEAVAQKSLGVVSAKWVSDVDRYLATRSADGTCPYEWRSGLKHDASSVFELIATPEPVTKTGQTVGVERDYLFPLLKSTDIFRGRHRELSKWVIVPQLKFGDETKHLEHVAPNLWTYLDSNAEVLDSRKSSIYKNRPRFSVFGHGEYSYAPFKVAVSGLHKKPVFRLLCPIQGKPVFLDDTCYFLAFHDPLEAALIWALLSSAPCQALIESLVFWDSKRPLTKKLLARLNVVKLPVDRFGITQEAVAAAKTVGVEVDDCAMRRRLDQLLDEPPARSTLF